MILFAIWYFLPAGIGNMVPIIVAKAPLLRRWDTPIDFGASYKGIRLLGDHKTIRGLVCGVFAGALIGLAQGAYIPDFVPDYMISIYSDSPLLLGGLLAFGALLGDAIKSFVKRRVGVVSGRSWFPFDQIDYIVGASLLAAIVHPLNIASYILIVIIWFGLHLLSSYIGYLTGFKKDPI